MPCGDTRTRHKLVIEGKLFAASQSERPAAHAIRR
jgi:hypothetical protein